MTDSTWSNLAQLRAAFPDWLFWQVGEQWWAKQKGSPLSARASEPGALSALLREQGVHSARQSSQPRPDRAASPLVPA